MTLQDIYDQLSFGELRHLSLSGRDIDETTGGMGSEDFIKLLPSIQLGLTELHKRFYLREGMFAVELQPNKTTYVLDAKYAQSNVRSKEAVKYIDDTDMVFENNLFKVEQIMGLYNGEVYEIPLNERGNPEGILTTSFNTLIVPTDETMAPWLKETTAMDVRYRANHPEINTYLANAAPLATPIHLPPTHLEALLFYIASRMYNPVGAAPGALHEGNNYFQRFLASCDELKAQNFEIDDNHDSDKLWSRGFC